MDKPIPELAPVRNTLFIQIDDPQKEPNMATPQSFGSGNGRMRYNPHS